MKMLLMSVLLLFVSQHASAVEVYEGVESVVLPCHVPADVSSNSTAVWDREELKDPKVHVRDQSGDDLSDQNDRYLGRTSMRGDALQTGDLSLTLRNPTVSDSGTYTCTTRRFGQDLNKVYVQLKVTEPPPPPPVWPKVLLAVLITLIILAAAFGLFVCSAYKRMKSREVLQPEVVEVPQGEKSVLLPFKSTADLPQAVTVEWTDYNNMKVHVYKSGNNQPDKQHQGYRGRTEMNKDPLRTKDLSLTLKDLRLTDSGVYTCTVYNKHGHMLLQKSVALSVRVSQTVKVEVAGVRTVQLPFKTTAVLPQDVTVEWTDFNNMTVHVYESGNNQPHKQDQGYRGRTEMNKDPLRNKDLSLTLKHLRLTDSGVYTCTVYNKDGHMLLQKSVALSVRDLKPKVVEVTQGEKSVLLPFKTTADLPQDVTVEWTDYNNMKVHVYESGNNQPDKQDQGYRGRTEMNKDPLRNKDLSLTLKDLHLTDSRVYTCTVYNKDGHMLLQKSVTLSVKDLPEEVKVTQGERSVLLPLKATADLPQDVTVEWIYYNNMKVHVYESGNNQPDKQRQGYRGRTEMKGDPLRTKDLSLTLKHFRPTDSGVYTCTVKKDGHMLLQKSVTVSVRAVLTESVEVLQVVESVLLPFKTTADLPQDVTVEWTHEHMMVHMYESGNNQPDKQYRIYRDRTEMNKDPLNTKDFSLTLKDLHLTDSGVYTCTVYNKDGHILLQKSVTLSVKDLQPEEVKVTQDEESVLLPLKTTVDLPQDFTVEWTYNYIGVGSRENMMVHVYESGNNQPDKQDQVYRGRTEMKEDRVKNKDLSLTLKKPLLTDSGVYICTVYNKNGDMQKQEPVILSFRALQPEVVKVTQGLRSVVLPFKTTADLPQNVTVEWRLTEPKHMKVHVYKSGNNQPDKQDQDYRGRTEMKEDPLNTKDLSLTLKHLHLTDSGVYTCTVYSKDGYMLLQKSVILSVRDLQPELVEVTQGESVLLPFKTTPVLPQGFTVEWAHKDKNVHVYEMDEDPLRNKDLSLTLKNLRLTDSGVYTCTVYNKDGHMLLEKSVILRVRATLMGTIAEMLPHRPCSRQRRAQQAQPDQEHRSRNHEDVPLMEVQSA